MSDVPPYGNAPGVYRGSDYQQPPDPLDGRTKVLSFSYKTASVLCYLPWCCCLLGVIASVLWLATEPRESRFVRFHAVQGLLLFAVDFIVSLIFNILGVGFEATTLVGTGSELAGAGASLIVTLISIVVAFGLLIIHVVAMVMAGQGRMWKIPLIGDIAERNA